MSGRWWTARPPEQTKLQQMKDLLESTTDGYQRAHTYRWREIHPKHRLGRRFKILAMVKQKLG